MNHFLALIHALGTKPLTVSLAAQFIVLALAIKSKDKERLLQSVVLIVGLTLAVVSITLRPPSPLLILPDALGTAAALFFIVPAIQALLKLRQPKSSG